MPPPRKVWIAVDTDLLLDPGDVDMTELDRGGQIAAYLAMIALCRRQEGDGFLREREALAAIYRACGSEGELTPERRLADIVLIGLVKRERWGYRILSYADWQQTRDTLSEARERARNAGRVSASRRTTRSTGRSTIRSTEGEVEGDIPPNPPTRGTESLRQNGLNPRALDARQSLVKYIERELELEGDSPGERERLQLSMIREHRAKNRDPDLVRSAFVEYADTHPFGQTPVTLPPDDDPLI